MKTHDVLKTLTETIDKALLAVNKSSGPQTAKSLDAYYKAFKRIARKLEDLVEEREADVKDISALEGHLDNLGEICTRRFHTDIRSWEDRHVQREDAKIVLNMMKMYWEGSYMSSKAVTPGMPKYHYKIGELVKIVSSKRTGKVVGIYTEGGTGRQSFEVKVVGIDKPKKYYVRQLSRVTKKSDTDYYGR